MATFTLATDEEQARLQKAPKTKRAVDLTVYLTAIDAMIERTGTDLAHAPFFKMALGADETRKGVRRRLTQAATEKHTHLRFRDHDTDKSIFWVQLRPAPVKRTPRTANGAVTTPATTPAPANGRTRTPATASA